MHSKLTKVVSRTGREIRKRASLRCCWGKKHLFLNYPLRLVAFLRAVISPRASFYRDFVQTDVLDGGPDNRQATGLRGEDIYLIGTLPHIAKQAFNGIGRLNVPMHTLRKLVKRQSLLFLLSQASDCFWIALAVFGECSPRVGPLPPVLWGDPRSQRVQLGPRLALGAQ